MWPFLAEFTRHLNEPVTVIVMDDDFREEPRQYKVQPRRLLYMVGGSVLALALLLFCLFVFTPLRELIPGYGTAELRRSARLAAVRLSALQDSLDSQQQYTAQLRALITGQADPAQDEGPNATVRPLRVSGELAEVAAEPNSKDWADHEQPALPLARMPIDPALQVSIRSVGERYISSLRLPALPPVSGFQTRGFDARSGHFAVDIAVEEGTMVRAIGDGYVIFADWTHEGGYALAIQHADGYISIYKHNQRLLKHVGDRVLVRDAIAVSGNSGEYTTGPHVHFELWYNGLAQDPGNYLTG